MKSITNRIVGSLLKSTSLDNDGPESYINQPLSNYLDGKLRDRLDGMLWMNILNLFSESEIQKVLWVLMDKYNNNEKY